MLAIVNVSDKDAPDRGINKYELRINRRVMCEFEHDRGIGNLSQCLRDAADAFDNQQKDTKEQNLDPTHLLDMLLRMKNN